MKILLVVYKIEAGKGSEDACGYNFAASLVEEGHEVTIVTRVNNAALLANDPKFEHARITGIDVPKWLAFYKKKGRGIILYYYLWQVFVGMMVKKLLVTEFFDVIHQFNFHTDWAPHFLSNSNGALIWGPVVHHERVPSDFLRHAGRRAEIAEWGRYLVKQTFWRLDPFLRHAVKRTDLVVYGNEHIAPAFRAAREKTSFRAYAMASAGFGRRLASPEHFALLSVGRLVPLKGFDISLDAFVVFRRRHPEAEATLTIVGEGPLEGELRARAAATGVADRVNFVPWLSHAELAVHYEQSAAFVFPSFESQGLVVAEAMAAGLPIVCLKGAGGAFVAGDAGIAISRGDYETVVCGVADALSQLWADFQDRELFAARMATIRDDYHRRLTAKAMTDDMVAAYADTLAVRQSGRDGQQGS